jgi:hypothetical protein
MASATASAIAAAPEAAVLEPISPELVLVDPELRRALQESAPERPLFERPRFEPIRELRPLPTPPREAPPQVRHERPRRRGRLLAAVLLPLSFGLGAWIAAYGHSDPVTTAVGHARSATIEPRATEPRATAPTTSPTAATAAPAVRSAAVERLVLARLIASPARKLPPRLIDEKTGLAKNGLQAICRRRAVGTYVCIVRPARHGRNEGMSVRYHISPGGRASFTWFRYRAGG